MRPRRRWTVLRDGKPWGDFEFSLAGEYNVLNATAAAALAANYGIPADAIAEALREFRSVKRRLEVKAEVHGITIIDDFAHHPTAIAQTLKAVRTRYQAGACGRFSSRDRILFGAKCFSMNWRRVWRMPMQVVLADVFKSEAIPEDERLDPAAVVADLNAAGKPARLLRDADAIVETICARAASGRCGRNPVQWRLRWNL